MQAKVKKLERKVTELVAKLSKHSQRLATGKRPTKWRTPSQIEEDIGKVRAKLNELQSELCKLELQASEDTGCVGGSSGVAFHSVEMQGAERFSGLECARIQHPSRPPSPPAPPDHPPVSSSSIRMSFPHYYSGGCRRRGAELVLDRSAAA